MSSGNLTRNAVRAALRRETNLRRNAVGGNPLAGNEAGQPLSQFSLLEFAKVDRLYEAFKILCYGGGAGAGEDDITYNDFSPGEIMAALRNLSNALVGKGYRPYASRPQDIPKGRNTAATRRLMLQRVLDRVVAKRLQLDLDSFWRARLPRLGKGVLDLYAEMQLAIRTHKAYWLAIDDIQNCFPNAPLDLVMECHRQYISQPDLLWLIETTIRGHEGPGRLTGLEQGSPYSPVAMELLLHTRLDTVFREEQCRGFPLLLRYVDNIIILCSSERECLQALQTAREILQGSELTLKGQDGPPKNLRSGHNFTLLGLQPGWNNGRLAFTLPESAFEDLEEGFLKSLRTPMPLMTAIGVAHGWLEAVGPVLTNAARTEVVRRLMEIAHSCGFTEMRETELLDKASEARQRWVQRR